MNEKNMTKELIYAFSEADSARLFSFTSGHLGALPISDKTLITLTQSGYFYQAVNTGMLLAIELVKYILFTILPIRNIGLILRTILRRLNSKKTESTHAMSVISLGNQSYENDSYFDILLCNLHEKFNYLKLVGGFNFKSENYEFIESALNYSSLTKLVLSVFLSPLFAIFYLLNRARTLNGCKIPIAFIILGLKEFNSGVFSNNKIIVASIHCWLANNHTKKILYPMEGRNWEKSIVETMNAKGIYSIGYLHCALTPRHFSLTKTGFYRQHEIPSVIVANSEMSAKLLTQTFPKVLVRKGFFLRGSKSDGKNVKQDSNTLLFALTGNIADSCEILNRLVASEIQTIYKVIIRLNPNTCTYNYLEKYAEKRQFTLHTGKEDFLPSICFFRSSSVALDYLKLNVLPVYISINEVITNNVFELDNKYQFKTLEIGRAASNQLAENIKKIMDDGLNAQFNGVKMSDYYLDQSINYNILTQLIN